MLSPSRLSRLVNTIGRVAVPAAVRRLPRLTASHHRPVPPQTSPARRRPARRQGLPGAIDSDTRYELELAGGRWRDSRHAARRALETLGRSAQLATLED